MKDKKKALTTHEQRELVYAHNTIFLGTLTRSGLSLAFSLYNRNGIEYAWAYNMKREAKQAEGI